MEKSYKESTSFEAAALCLKKNIPFCLYCLPGREEPVFFSNPSGQMFKNDKKTRSFIIGKWNTTFNERIEIREEIGAIETIDRYYGIKSFTDSFPHPPKDTTSAVDYYGQVELLIKEIRENKLGKVVLSTVSYQPLDADFNKWIEITKEIFSAYIDTFRFLYFTHETGAWIGATPELLLDYDEKERKVNTISLAGTRQSTLSVQWDEKNRKEQSIVTEYIVNRLEDIGFKIEKNGPRTIKMGSLEHLQTDISAKWLNGKFPPFNKIIDKLNPTPALCGYPVEEACNLISKLEKHKRSCYGGYVGVEDLGGYTVYVNIRCCHFDDRGFSLYAGGGILPESQASSEFEEIVTKRKALGQFLENI